MRVAAMVLGLASCCLLTACTPSGAVRADSNLECSALISAATYVVAGGKAANDPVVSKRGLVSLMTYLNTYAIPKKLKEREAFEELHALRAKMMEALEPADIMRRARKCVDRTPGL